LDNHINLQITKRTDPRLLELMRTHYSRPKGFVGRSICYAILYGDDYYGHIVAGSATRFLPGRNEFLQTNDLNTIVNNTFYNIHRVNGKYPARNFTTQVVKHFIQQVTNDWKTKYGDVVSGFETLIELPRIGELYRRAGFVQVGTTKGFTCKRVGGYGTDSWTGARVWDTKNLRPKLVLCHKGVEKSGQALP